MFPINYEVTESSVSLWSSVCVIGQAAAVVALRNITEGSWRSFQLGFGWIAILGPNSLAKPIEPTYFIVRRMSPNHSNNTAGQLSYVSQSDGSIFLAFASLQ